MVKPFLGSGFEGWRGDFEWVEPETTEPPPNTHIERSKRRSNRLNLIVPMVGALAAIAAFSAYEKLQRGPSRFDRLAAQFQANHYANGAIPSFALLANMTPQEIDRNVIKNREGFGQEIQNAAAVVFVSELQQGLDNKGLEVDMYDAAEQLIAPDSLKTLVRDGIEFTREAPVECDAPAPWGDYGYNPLDYSNHPPGDFKVRTQNIDGREVTLVPLGTQEMPSTAHNPFSFALNFPNITLSPDWPPEPCADKYPHEIYPPNDTTYPPGTKYSIELY